MCWSNLFGYLGTVTERTCKDELFYGGRWVRDDVTRILKLKCLCCRSMYSTVCLYRAPVCQHVGLGVLCCPMTSLWSGFCWRACLFVIVSAIIFLNCIFVGPAECEHTFSRAVPHQRARLCQPGGCGDGNSLQDGRDGWLESLLWAPCSGCVLRKQHCNVNSALCKLNVAQLKKSDEVEVAIVTYLLINVAGSLKVVVTHLLAKYVCMYDPQAVWTLYD